MNRATGVEEENALRHVFLFIGAVPNACWLDNCGVTLDGKGFVKTGAELSNTDLAASFWKPLDRLPLPLETSRPGVFAIGDVRAGSVKRVAAAVGELAGLVFPTTLLPARSIGQEVTVELNGKFVPTFRTYIHNTDPGANAGIPGLSIPAGLTSDGLPLA